MISWEVESVQELDKVASELLAHTGKRKIFLFHGQPGAGKTTFIKVLCKLLGVTDLVNSPTFALVHEYAGLHNVIYHLDLYRLRNVAELYDIGFEQYLDSDAYCLVEWPEKLEGLLNQPKADIFISIQNGNRVITCTYE